MRVRSARVARNLRGLDDLDRDPPALCASPSRLSLVCPGAGGARVGVGRGAPRVGACRFQQTSGDCAESCPSCLGGRGGATDRQGRLSIHALLNILYAKRAVFIHRHSRSGGGSCCFVRPCLNATSCRMIAHHRTSRMSHQCQMKNAGLPGSLLPVKASARFRSRSPCSKSLQT